MAVHRGNSGKRLLLIGHLDTVLQGEAFRVEGDRAYGTGISDMKGGDVIVVEALRALHATGALEGRQVIVVFTGDEEDTGVPQSESRKALFDAASQSDVALAFEGAAPGVAVVGRRGIGTWRLHVTGEQAHSSGIFRESRGYGAIFETARILDRFRVDLPEQYLTYNPSVIVGGTERRLRRGHVERDGARQDQRDSARGLRDGRHPFPDGGAVRGGPRQDGSDRGRRICRGHRLRSRSRRNIHPWRRPTATGRCSPCSMR